VQVNPRRKRELDLKKVRARLVNSTQAAGNDFLVRFSPEEGISIVIFKDARVLIHGTNDIVKAKSLYAKYIGE
jgi:adenylyltransferase/sulfurtransferase